MKRSVAAFRDHGSVYYADTCEPLREGVRRGEVSLEALAQGGYPGQCPPPQSLKEIRSVGFWDAPRNQTWSLDEHRNEGIEITYVSQGNVAFGVGEQAYPLRRGHLTITRPWQPHWVGNPHVPACRLHWLILDVGIRYPHDRWLWPPWMFNSTDNLEQLTKLLQYNEQPVWQANAEIEQCFESLASTITNSSSETLASRIKLRINELLILLLELLQHGQITLDKTLTLPRRSVEMFLTGLPQRASSRWDLTAMARECGLGRSQFTYHCQKLTNMSPIKYLTHCRINNARKLLKDQPEMTITAVAYACGFESSQYFATVFRNSVGCSPRTFRKRLL